MSFHSVGINKVTNRSLVDTVRILLSPVEAAGALLITKPFIRAGAKTNYSYHQLHILELLVVRDVHMSCYRLDYGFL